jgi:hypothetical protein
MNFKEFLTQARNTSFWQQKHAFCFTGTEHSFRFFTQLFTLLKQYNVLGLPYQHIDSFGREKRELHGLLNQSMLGNNSFFWLGNLSEERESKAAAAFKEFACLYTGPHTISFFIETDQLPKAPVAQVIQLPSMLDYYEFIALATFFQFTDVKKLVLVDELFNNHKQPLTRCLEFLDYVSLASSKNPAEFTAYLNIMYENETSLQQLAGCFFAKQEKAFFAHWHAVQNTYPAIFWVIFWSEQLWRAIHVTQFMRQKQFALAKKMSYRLPYVFISQDWQQSNLRELIQAHAFLYQIDFAIKTGSSFCSQDLFFTYYFAGLFAKESANDPL